MMADGPIFSPQVSLAGQLDKMVASGVETVRVVFDWAQAQPYRRWADVPAAMRGQFSPTAGGAPTDFAATDEIMELAAQRGLDVLPVVLYAPSWDALPGAPAQPRAAAPYARYLTALVERYGPGGSFWTDDPGLGPDPIHQWQIWNEPNISDFWTTEPFARSYVTLLRAAHAAVKAADPTARVVLAGLANRSWLDLRSIYEVRGAASLFDLVAVHPYTGQAQGVITILSYVRRVMDHHGDRAKPMLVTELGWPSSLGESANTFGVATTPSGQASRLAAVIPMLASARTRLGIAGFDVYTWIGEQQRGASPFGYSGLFGFDPVTGTVSAKPAYAVFRDAALALEGCHVKAAVATSCASSG
jgi:hypothetical protein